jgi:hypothetical protein
MFTKHISKPFYVTIGTAFLGAVLAAAPAQAADDYAWVREQLSISDGSPEFAPRNVRPIAAPPGPRTAVTYQRNTQSEWLQKQLAASDGSPVIADGSVEQTYVAVPSSVTDAKAAEQFAFVEHALRVTDGGCD